MGLLRRLADWWTYDPVEANAIVVEDAVFGVVKDNGPDLWRKHDLAFQPGMPLVHISLPGDDSGPSQYARDLYLDLKNRFIDLRPKAALRLFELSDVKFNKKNHVTDADGFFRLCRLESISIFEDDVDVDVELGFSIPHDPEHTYWIQFRNWEVCAVVCS